MLRPNHVTATIEQIGHGGMGVHEPMSLPNRLELPHPSLPNPGRLVRLLGLGSEVRTGKLPTALQLTSIIPTSQLTSGSA